MERIIYVIGTMGRGGAESQLLMLMEEMQKAGFRPGLFVLEEQGDLLEHVRSLGIRIWSGGYDSGASRARKVGLLLRCLLRLWRLLRRERPRIVHGFLPLANLYTALCGRLAGVPCVITSRRALNTHQDRVPGWRLVDMLSARLSDQVIANSIAVKDDTLRREGGDPEKIRVIHNGISADAMQSAVGTRDEVRQELGLLPTDEVLIIVANLIPYKGHRELLEAVARLRRDHPCLRLVVVGEDRGIGNDLKKLAAALGIADSVFWLGMRRDVSRLLAAADLYVSASHEEGFSNALLEALAAGLPAVATRVGGNPEMLEEGALGLLVEPGDVERLASAIGHLLDDAQARQRLGKRAAARIRERYAPHRMALAYIQCYRECPR